MSAPAEIAPGCPDPQQLQAAGTLRPATPEDLDGVEAVERASFGTPWSRAALRQEIADIPWSRTLVCERDGRVIGFMMYWLVGPELHLLNLAVEPASRGLGVARQLVAHLVDSARAGLREEIVLEVRPSNTAARRLYEGFGFEQLTVRRGYYPDTGEDALVMGLKLVQNDG